MNNKRIVEGFEFENDEEYELALKDVEMFEILWKKIKNSDGQTAIEIYESLLASEKVKTVVGMYNVKMLQNYLVKCGYMTRENVMPIVGFVGKKVSTSEAMKSYEYTYRMKYMTNKKIDEKIAKYKSTVASLKVAVLILSIVIAVLFVVHANSGSANYASAKEAVIDEYSNWEESLNNRESKVKEKEEELNAATAEVEK